MTQPSIDTSAPAGNRDDLAPGVVPALVWAVLGIFLCGVIVGWIAINYARNALEAIREDPSLSGAGLAKAAIGLGLLEIVTWSALLFAAIAGGITA